MKITDERLIEILNNNNNIITLSDDSGKIDISVISPEPKDNIYNIEVLVQDINFEESYLLLEVDTTNYNEKFVDVHKSLPDDMGILIKLQVGEDLEEFNETNMWRSLYYNK